MYQLKISFRNLRRGGIYSIINIGGLAIGMAAAILILAWIYHQWSYDRFHTKEKLLNLAYIRTNLGGSSSCFDLTPYSFGPTLKSEYPDIAGVAKMVTGTFLYANGDTKLKINIGVTDPDFLTMFDFPLLQGDKETAFIDPYSVILTENAAIRLFGRDDPMGQTLLTNGQYSMTVTGIMKDLPGNTMLNFEALLSFLFLKEQGWLNDNWTAYNFQTFVELQPNAQLDLVNESIRDIINSHTNNAAQTDVFLYPLNKQHLYSKFENGVPVGGLIETLRLYGIIAGLILLIACINFMNLSTARSEKRTKEVGLRKVMGGKRLSLIRLFLGESMVVAFIAAIIALNLALLVLPVFNTMMGQQITLNLTNSWFWIAGLGFVVFTGLLAGSYPAFYLSSFLPVKVLKGVFRGKQTLISPRKILVVLQFTVACALIVSTLVIHRQIKYAQSRESGYDKDQLIYASLEGDILKNYELIRQELLNSKTALSVTKTNSPVTAGLSFVWEVGWRGKDPDTRVSFSIAVENVLLEMYEFAATHHGIVFPLEVFFRHDASRHFERRCRSPTAKLSVPLECLSDIEKSDAPFEDRGNFEDDA
jgi:ABC-type antimicrobial peptide transport system permease subunit